MNKTRYFFATLIMCVLSLQFAYAQPACVAPEIQMDIEIDLTGLESVDLLDDADNTVITICNAALANKQLTHFQWDNVLLVPVGASWCSEGVIAMNFDVPVPGNGVQLTPHIGEPNVGPCVVSGSGGYIDLAAIPIPVFADASGCVSFQLFESFDDFPNAVDGAYASGTITLSGCAEPLPTVPTVGEWGLIVLGLFILIAGVVFMRSSQTRLITESVKA